MSERRQRLLLVVEGPHDVEIVAHALRRLATFERVGLVDRLKALDRDVELLIPKQYPPGGDISKRVDVPTFFSSANATVAVRSAEGKGNLIQAMNRDLVTRPDTFDAFAVICDADADPLTVSRKVARGLAAIGLPVPNSAGSVHPGPPRCGYFVLPDNRSAGTVEDVLLASGRRTYTALAAESERFVQAASVLPELNSEDLKHLRKPAGAKKAQVAAIASILRPGKAIQVSIQDNRWFAEGATELDDLAAFLGRLIGPV